MFANFPSGISDWVQNMLLQVDTTQILTLIRLSLLRVDFSKGWGKRESVNLTSLASL